MIGKWLTVKEAQEQFEVSRSTINRWRETFNVRETRLLHHPILLHHDDLADADAKSKTRNPVIR